MPRSTLMLRWVLSAALLTLATQLVLAAEGPLAPVNLRCEYLKNPVGIDVRQPRLAWVDLHTQRAEAQSAYQLLVATSPELLAQNKGDQWDSGKTASDDSTHVVYGGKALESNHSYWWKVRYWDKDGNASEWSEPASFGVALLSPDEWQAQWIGGANQLRHEFDLAEAPRRARIYICGLGYYELRINGEKIGHNYSGPGLHFLPEARPLRHLRRHVPPPSRRQCHGRDAGRRLVPQSRAAAAIGRRTGQRQARERDQQPRVEGEERPHRERQHLEWRSLRRAPGDSRLGHAGIPGRRLGGGAKR